MHQLKITTLDFFKKSNGRSWLNLLIFDQQLFKKAP